MISSIIESLQEGWNWLAGGCIWVVDHWSGAAALIIFSLQLFINIRKIRKGDD